MLFHAHMFTLLCSTLLCDSKRIILDEESTSYSFAGNIKWNLYALPIVSRQYKILCLILAPAVIMFYLMDIRTFPVAKEQVVGHVTLILMT